MHMSRGVGSAIVEVKDIRDEKTFKTILQKSDKHMK